MTASALVATPQLVIRLVAATAHPSAWRLARWVWSLLRLVAGVLYAAVAVSVALLLLSLALAPANRPIALATILGLTTLAGAVAFGLKQLQAIAAEIATGGDLDRAARERIGEERIWLIAGLLFLSGTIVQLIGTFVE